MEASGELGRPPPARGNEEHPFSGVNEGNQETKTSSPTWQEEGSTPLAPPTKPGRCERELAGTEGLNMTQNLTGT